MSKLVAATVAPRRGPLAALATVAALLHAGGMICDAQAAGAGRLQGISFFGNRVTKEYVLLRELRFGVGDDVTLEQVNDARQRLQDLEFISYADIQPKQVGEGNVHLVVQIEEAPRFQHGLVFEFDERQEGILAGVELGMRNFRGRGERLEARAAAGAAQRHRLRWENPWLLGRLHLALFLEGGWERYDFVYEPFRLTQARGAVGLERRVGRWLRLGVSTEFRRLDLGYADEVSAGVDVSRNDPAVVLALECDGRDCAEYPHRGVLGRVRWQLAGLDEGDRYDLYDAGVASFLDPLWGIVLGARVAWRGASEPLPVYARTYFSGLSDVRGIEDGSVHGDEHFLASAEARWPALEIPLPQDDGTIDLLVIGLHGFHDWGKAWRYGAAFDDERVQRSYGLGLHVAMKDAALRLEWARTADGENRFVFGDSFTF
jgi:outer membrane protein assembly factor BamA